MPRKRAQPLKGHQRPRCKKSSANFAAGFVHGMLTSASVSKLQAVFQMLVGSMPSSSARAVSSASCSTSVISAWFTSSTPSKPESVRLVDFLGLRHMGPRGLNRLKYVKGLVREAVERGREVEGVEPERIAGLSTRCQVNCDLSSPLFIPFMDSECPSIRPASGSRSEDHLLVGCGV